MKKFALAFSVLLLTLSSCSKSDTTTQDPILVKKTIDTDSKTGTSTTTTITYSGTKMVSVIATGRNPFKEVFTYTGDLITKTEFYDTTTNLVTDTNDYTYLNGVLSTYIHSTPTGTTKDKTLYIHFTDGTVNVVNSKIITATNLETPVTSTAKNTYTNGNLIKTDYSTTSVVNTTSYEYDSKNNPTKNITGINLLLNFDSEVSVNNWTKSTDVYGTTTTTVVPVYTYNSNNYPTQQVNGTTTTQYFY